MAHNFMAHIEDQVHVHRRQYAVDHFAMPIDTTAGELRGVIYCLFHVTWPHDIFTNKVIPNSDRSYLLNAVQEFDKKCTIQLGRPHRSCLASTDCRRTRFLKSVFCTPSVSQGPELTGLHMAQGPPKYCRVLYRCLGSREMTKS